MRSDLTHRHVYVHQVKALSEELENPDNTHRWRKLEGADPGTFEMVQKIQALQKVRLPAPLSDPRCASAELRL